MNAFDSPTRYGFMKKNKTKIIHRRDFLKNLATATATAAVYTSGLSALTTLAIRSKAVAAGEDEFDYIVVGTGAGGGPLACNLAEAGFHVLLLEAGDHYESPHYTVPVFHGLSTEDPYMSWEFYVKHYSQKNKRILDSKYQKEQDGVLYPRAATLGGCTAHNAMITLYPDNEDWQDIAKLTNDSSWNPRAMRNYFQKVERNGYVAHLETNPELRGYQGWLSTEQTSPLVALKDPKLKKIIIAAAEAEGVSSEVLHDLTHFDRGSFLLDPNSWSYVQNKVDGLFNIPKATSKGRRNGTRERILTTLQNYPNQLILRTQAHATRVIFDEREKTRAVGVEYGEGSYLYGASPLQFSTTQSYRKRVVKAKREVILSGGAFNSPQLLMLSGIGPRTELEKHGIEVRVDLPGVGKNLQDRYEVGVVTELKSELDLLKNCGFESPGDQELKNYWSNPLDSIYSSNGVVISMLKHSNRNNPKQDLCIFGLPGHFRGYYPGWAKDSIQKNHFTWAILKGHTKNTAGSVTLKSNDPLQTPEIEFKYFDEGNDVQGEDLKAMVKALKFVRRLNRGTSFQDVAKQELVPGPAVESDDALKEFVMKEAWGHHASCSNKMGPKQDPLAVVDSDFKVHGTKNLRIVDASVFPKIPGLFIVAPTYMISEKASEVILRRS